MEVVVASGCKSRSSCLCYFFFCCQGSFCSVAQPSEVANEILGGSYDGLHVIHIRAKVSYHRHFPSHDGVILFVTGHLEI